MKNKDNKFSHGRGNSLPVRNNLTFRVMNLMIFSYIYKFTIVLYYYIRFFSELIKHLKRV